MKQAIKQQLSLMETIMTELREAKAHFVEEGKKGSRTYKFPWGQELTMGPGIEQKRLFLSEMRHHVAKHQHVKEEPVEVSRTPIPLAPPPPPPAPEPAKFNPLIEIDKAIESARKKGEELMAAAGREEKRITLLQAIRTSVTDLGPEALQATLEGILPQQPEPPPPPPPAPPEQKPGDRIRIVQTEVLGICQTFDGNFLIDDILVKLANGSAIDEIERRRARGCLNSMLWQLTNNGRIRVVKAGRGKSPAIFNSHVNEVGTTA